MNNLEPAGKEDKSVSSILGEMVHGLKSMIQGEIHLAKAEMKEATSQLGKNAAQMAAFGALAAISILPFIAFLVVGLGAWLNDNYWLSSLIVAAVCASVGGFFAYRAFQRMKESDVTLTHTRQSVRDEIDTVNSKVHEITEAARRRVS